MSSEPCVAKQVEGGVHLSRRGELERREGEEGEEERRERERERV